MSYQTPTTALLGLGVFVIGLIILRIRDFARLKHIPGPSLAGWTDLWMIRAQASGRMNLIMQEVTNEYGKYCIAIL